MSAGSEPLYVRAVSVSAVIGWVLIGIGVAQLLWQFESGRYVEGLYSHRFQDDIAGGAAANALEHIAHRISLLHGMRPGDWLIAGILSLIYSRLPH